MIYDKAAAIAKKAVADLKELRTYVQTQEDTDAILDGFWDNLVIVEDAELIKLCECK